METDCGHYFKTATALKIWRENDSREEDKLYKCLLQKKGGFFKGVVHKNGKIREDVLEGFAETAFNDTYIYCRDKARQGSLEIEKEEYTYFFYTVFKRMCYKLYEKAEREGKAGATFFSILPESYGPDDQENRDALMAKIMAAMGKMGQSCQQLIRWRYFDGLTTDEIAAKTAGKITRVNVIKMLSRCTKDLRDKV